jgi:hypothetical protein
MNQKIKELAVQSKLGNAEFGNGVQYYVATQETFEKFAELIVKECISSVGSQADKAYLKKHFGLPVESDIIYPATDESWSVETQYKRKYNLAPDRDMGGI